ncbi:MAG TPA: DUF2127 domain-containing protein [Candidatus Paceibacterota bacterium]|jgi:uncharacterized membrane protein|nr:DUF2127 domain-containing protein [Candidatus Paceibacterota bacterium]
MNDTEKEQLFHSAFFATVILNGLIAIADIFAGLFFLFERQIAALAYSYHYPLSHIIQGIFMELMKQSQLMGILYFFSHGIIKLFLVWGLLTNRLWAYPTAIVFLAGFSIYQIYDLFIRFSWFTILLLVVNCITIFFIAREYRSL